MAQSEFDQACRFVAKLDPAGLLAWLLGLALDAFLFRGWLDTRTISFPGEPERTCDTVAHLERAEYGGLALVLAEAAKRKPLWKEALKEWNMILSETVQEWKAEGRAEGRTEGHAKALVVVLSNRFGQLPGELLSLISKTKDEPTLTTWLAVASKAPSLDVFRQATMI